MKTLAQQIFYGLTVELLILFVTYIFKGHKKIAIFIFIAGTILAGVIAFVPFPIGGASNGLYVFDDFDDLRYEDTYNTELWKPFLFSNDDLFQQNGSLVVSDTADNDSGFFLNFRDPNRSEFTYIETKVRFSNKVYSGDGII
jgi:hypothetical protein